MGKRFLRSMVSDFQNLSALADIVPVDLPVNPLSQIILTLAMTKNVAGQATNLGNLATAMIGSVTDCSIRHRGETIIQGSLLDLAVINALITGQGPGYGDFGQADNEVQFVSIPLNFSRFPLAHEEGFPATQRGNLRFFMSCGAHSTLWDAAQWCLESVELIEDQPTRFLKYTTLTKVIGTTGRQRIALPIGNELLGLMLADPSFEYDTGGAYAFGKVKLLKDNVEQYFAESNWESLRETCARRFPNFHLGFGHTHALAAADTATGEEQVFASPRPPHGYGYLDFDPLRDSSYSLETTGAAGLDLDINSDVSTGTVRMLPVELVQVGGAVPAA